MIVIPSGFIGDVGFIACFILCLLPLELEVGFRDFSRLNELHIVDIDRLSDEVRLLKASLIVIVDKTID